MSNQHDNRFGELGLIKKAKELSCGDTNQNCSEKSR